MLLQKKKGLLVYERALVINGKYIVELTQISAHTI